VTGISSEDIRLIEIVDVSGRKVHSQSTVHVDISSLSAGLYFVRLTSTTDKVMTKKLVKQ